MQNSIPNSLQDPQRQLLRSLFSSSELSTKVYDQLDIRALRVKSYLRWTNPDLTYFRAPDKAQLELPKYRALLLDYLQGECEKFSFSRELYYLSQCYLDNYLEKDQSIQIQQLKMLGITCMHLALKMENYIQTARDTLRETSLSAEALEQAVVVLREMEKTVLTVLDFKLTPDTLIFWLDLIIRLWDLYVE